MERENRMQNTIMNEVKYSGTALHSGKKVNIKCLPARVDTGIVFRRIDLEDRPEIKVEPKAVVSTRRCTSLGLPQKEISVHTVEHLLAALWALDIDNIIIEIDNSETPVGDGSALPLVELFQRAGIKKLNKAAGFWKVNEPLWVDKGGMRLIILPYNGFKISYTLDYDHDVIGTQFLEYERGSVSFMKEIAPARTFGFEHEVKALQRKGLALGGSLDNAVLVGEKSIVNSLRYPDEFVRHKILDIIGDMALNGVVKGHIISIKSGHELHVQLARKIREKGEYRRE